MAEASLKQTVLWCAGANPNNSTYLMTMTYNGVERNVEVYSTRVSKDGALLLFGYCHKDGKIESFRVDRIKHPKATTEVFGPRYKVEPDTLARIPN